MAISSADILVLSLCGLLSLWLWARGRRSNRLPHPPGPRGLPLIGNLLDLPSPQDKPWEVYSNWSHQHNSDIIHISALGTNIVIASSLEVVNELLDKRSALYSDRPRMIMLNELCGFGWGMAFLPYGDSWRDSRRMAHQEFHSGPVKRFRPNEQKSAHQFLVNMYRQPEKMMHNLRHLAGSTIMSVAYDIDVKAFDDPYILTAEAAAESISETTNAGSYFVDVLPFLRYVPEWFPGAGFQKDAKRWRVAVERLRDAPYENVKQRMLSGDLSDCAAKSLLERYSKDTKNAGYIDFTMRSSLGSVYVGKSEQTVSALGSFFLAMTLHPEIQEKARKELDQVVGSQRLPDFSDQPSLPYIDAIVRESLRWNPVVPVDVPHMLSEDDVYNGYYLPKGTLVVANQWAILHDEKAYHDPLTYNPDRFLRPDGTLDPNVRDPSVAAFGFGRRICPGRFMAIDSMWITIACVLAVFDIKKAIGEDGKEVTPDGEYISGFFHPKPFPCVVKPRSKEHEALLMELARQDA
ncbi:cytochrome P450 [Earliella scabrosa]|nr:cytochrome P450 [Earliella scabrosa]